MHFRVKDELLVIIYQGTNSQQSIRKKKSKKKKSPAVLDVNASSWHQVA